MGRGGPTGLDLDQHPRSIGGDATELDVDDPGAHAGPVGEHHRRTALDPRRPGGIDPRPGRRDRRGHRLEQRRRLDQVHVVEHRQRGPVPRCGQHRGQVGHRLPHPAGGQLVRHELVQGRATQHRVAGDHRRDVAEPGEGAALATLQVGQPALGHPRRQQVHVEVRTDRTTGRRHRVVQVRPQLLQLDRGGRIGEGQAGEPGGDGHAAHRPRRSSRRVAPRPSQFDERATHTG